MPFARKRPTTDATMEPSDAILARLQALHPKKIDLSLGRIERLLDRLDRPQDRLPPAIHVAGTNGKGSVVAFLRAILETAGYRVHSYTSPHLVRFNERIRIAGEVISDEALSAILDECERANEGETITFFEITTAAAFLAFSRTPADMLLLECGLGGRFDATNVIDRPAATIITPVSFDHMHFLGDTLTEIAGEKAAIQKEDVPSIVAPQLKEAGRTIAAAAKAVGAPSFVYGRDWTVSATDTGLRYRSEWVDLTLPTPGLLGRHQLINAGTAVACLEQIEGLEITDTAISEGLPAARWPGRLQPLTDGPLADLLPPGWELWLDGGHNMAAAAALAETVGRWDDMPLYLVFAMMHGKSPADFLQPLAPTVKGLCAIAIPGHDGSLSAADCADAAVAAGIPSHAAEDVEGGIRDILQRELGPARILICGSLYLAGAVLGQNAGTAPTFTAG
ncbi:MAG: bifunctional folylpolyglutamate synthase/dihydrofolate synthase [Alphaproteobacteria bacterium]|nr:bifunctional folylpolyglutamate synthase/dihydrofolate synthase [Alphaproteobacteria bacterium]